MQTKLGSCWRHRLIGPELNAFLMGEGSTDYAFLTVLLERALGELAVCKSLSVAPVQRLQVNVGDPIGRHRAICSAARDAAPSLSVLFVHYDGSASVERETGKYWDPLRREWEKFGPSGRLLLRVVPIQEMESWALADRKTLQSVVGASWNAKDIFEGGRLDRPEELSDPKRTLREIIAAGRSKRRVKRDPRDYLPLIAERMNLRTLEQLSSFRLWQLETEKALADLNFN
ncbi:DUF4276 family protein [Kitasatospora sp. SolWspMP-SS2h]|uniref:DUF4276 family protein n=1 Tax=Kitasatospora sp. SolWspMP-SS2h TaxID=1305729 RepID=UPI000DB953AD|nr:DUF4276 family protein [Kitasatospora sp. SolWspMP-SS2h]